MDAFELRATLEEWHEQVCKLAAEHRAADQARDIVWAEGIGVALDQALLQVRRIKALLHVGAVA